MNEAAADWFSRMYESFTVRELEIAAVSLGFISYTGLIWLTAPRLLSDLAKAPHKENRVLGNFNQVLTLYLENIRVLYHCTFFVVLLGGLYDNFAVATPRTFGLLYIFFNVFLYGGIYTMNQLSDLGSDRAHPRKRHRPVASGRLSVPQARLFVTLSWIIGVSGAYFLNGVVLVYVFLLFIAINVFYSTWSRDIPGLDIITNASTYPLRFFMGGLVAGIRVTASSAAAVFCLGIMMVTMKRIYELRTAGWNVRKSLEHTGPRTQYALHYGSFFAALVLTSVSGHTNVLLSSRIVLLCVFLISGTSKPSKLNTTLLIAFVIALNALVIPYALEQRRFFFVLESIAILLFVVILSLPMFGGLTAVFDKITTF